MYALLYIIIFNVILYLLLVTVCGEILSGISSRRSRLINKKDKKLSCEFPTLLMCCLCLQSAYYKEIVHLGL